MFATIAYAGIAGCQLTKMSGQLKIMIDTYGEIQKQTSAVQCAAAAAQQEAALMRQQLEGTMAAVLYVSPPGIRVDPPGSLDLVIYNDGSVSGQDFHGVITVAAVTIPSKRTIKSVPPMTVMVSPIPVPPSNHPPVLQQPTQKQYQLAISAEEASAFRRGDYGFMATGSFTYLNGIDVAPKSIPVCIVAFRDPEYPEANIDTSSCDNVSLEFKSVQMRAEEDKKHQQNKK